MASLNEITGGGLGRDSSRLSLPDIPKNELSRMGVFDDIKDFFQFSSASTPKAARLYGEAIREGEGFGEKAYNAAVGAPLLAGTMALDVPKAIFEGGFDIAKMAVPQGIEDWTLGKIQDVMEIPAVAKVLEEMPDLLAEDDDSALLRLTEAFAGSAVEVGAEFAGGRVGSPVLKQGLRLADVATPSRVRQLWGRSDKFSKGQADSALRKFYIEQLDRNKGLREKLAKLARIESTDANRVTSATIIDDLIESGIFPMVRDLNFDFEEHLFDVNNQIKRIGEARVAVAENLPGLTAIDDLMEAAYQNALNYGSRTKSSQYRAEINRQFESLSATYQGRKHLTKAELNEIVIDKGRSTKSFNKEEFEVDVDGAIKQAANEAFMAGLKKGSRVYRGNEAMSRLFRVEKALRQMSGQGVKLNPLIDYTGRYLGAVTLGGGLATGNGAILVAGLFAHMGGKAFLQLILNKRLNPRVRAAMLIHAKKDKQLTKEILDEAARMRAELEATPRLTSEVADPGSAAINLGPSAMATTRKTLQQEIKSLNNEISRGGHSKKEMADLEARKQQLEQQLPELNAETQFSANKTPDGAQEAARFSPAPIDPETKRFFKAFKSISQLQNKASQEAAIRILHSKIETAIREGMGLDKASKLLQELAKKEGTTLQLREAQDIILKIANEIGPI